MSTASLTRKNGKKTSSRTSVKAPPKTFIKKKLPESNFSVPPVTESKPTKLRIFIQKFTVTTVIQKLKSGKKTQTLSIIVLSLLFVSAVGVAVYSYTLYKQSELQVKKLQNTKETAKAEAQKIIEAVGKLIILPKDETPTIATVTDSKKLQNQPFFAKSTNGDKVLIYSKAKKAILFNPSQNKVVEVAPVNIGKTNKPEVAGVATVSGVPSKSPSPTKAVLVVPTAAKESLQPTTVPQE